MIFVLAVIGCATFSVYAAGLFFRYKSRESGVLLALGVSSKVLGRQLRQEVLRLTLASCGAGLVLGTPLCWMIWSIFRLTLVDTPEMTLIFDLHAYGIPVIFTAFVFIALLIMQRRFLSRVNVLDIIQESHFFYRADQKMIGKTDIEDLAAKYGVKITDYVEMPSASLAVDGDQYIETNGPIGTTYIEAYTKTLFEPRFFWCLHGMRSLGMTLH